MVKNPKTQILVTQHTYLVNAYKTLEDGNTPLFSIIINNGHKIEIKMKAQLDISSIFSKDLCMELLHTHVAEATGTARNKLLSKPHFS